MSTLLVKIKEMFSFQQGLHRKIVPLIADRCQHLKKLRLDDVTEILDYDIIRVIKKLGKQLTTLVLDGEYLTDGVYSYLKNCTR
jgi:hypothetical protein